MKQLLPLIELAVAGLGLCALVLVLRAGDQRRRDARRQVVRLWFPAGLEAEAVVAFMRSLAALRSSPGALTGRDSVVFELVASAKTIEHRLRLPANRADFILGQLRAAVPAIGVEPVKPGEGERSRLVLSARQWRLAGSQRGLRTDRPESVAAAVLAALRPLRADQSITVQWVMVAGRPDSVVPMDQARPHVPDGPWLQTVSRIVAGSGSTGERPSAKEQRDKAAEPPFEVVLRIGAGARTLAAAAALVRRVAGVLRVAERPGVHFVGRWLPTSWAVRSMAVARTPVSEFGCRLNAREVATVLGWPVGTPSVPGLRLGASRRLEPRPEVPSRGRVLGTSNLAGSTRTVALSAADSLHHLHIVGPTGVGKSTLLANLITGDISAGRAVVVLDPKGDLVKEVADRIPAGRVNDVILLDPTDETRPVGLNLLHGADSDPELVTDAVVAIFHRLYAAYWGPRTSDLVTSALLTLAQRPGMTLCELPLVFTDEGFRRRLTAGLSDPVLGGFWAWYEAISPAERAAALGPVMNKLRAFLLRRRLRNVLGQAEPTWSLAEVLNRQGVLLVNLAKGSLGSEAAALLGSVVVSMLWRAIQVRTVRLPAMVVIDEFQDVVNLPTDLGEVLAQARGFGVGLTLAHQHLGQLNPALRQAVLANARTKVVFQTAADDAAILARQLGGGLNPSDLTGLEAHHAYVAACVGGEVLTPASIVTNPPVAGLGSTAAVRQASRERYGRDRGQVEANMAGRHQAAADSSGGLGRRRRNG